jgi:hypothetical protein
MPSRASLHRLVEDLPESEVPRAERVLVALREAAELGGPQYTLETAPPDDEPDDDDFDGGLTEAREAHRRGEGIPHEEVKRRWGLE